MPKLKTHKGAQKRFKVTAKKKILHSKANKSHILTKKSSKRIRHLGKKDGRQPGRPEDAQEDASVRGLRAPGRFRQLNQGDKNAESQKRN